MKIHFYLILLLAFCGCSNVSDTKIDRESLVRRNTPRTTSLDPLSPFTVGNGGFAFTVDATGLQTFPHIYKEGVPLGAQSDWGWHEHPNTQGFTPGDILKPYDMGRDRIESYAVQKDNSPYSKAASDWFRANPHRLHLGMIGLALDEDIRTSHICNIEQHLDMWEGIIHSRFTIKEHPFHIETVCHPQTDAIGIAIQSDAEPRVRFHFPYPSDQFITDGCDWENNHLHHTSIAHSGKSHVVLKRQIDATIYYVTLAWEGEAAFAEKETNDFTLISTNHTLRLSCAFSEEPLADNLLTYNDIKQASVKHWNTFWNTSAAVDFSFCKDKRSKELERRIVLSQYLLATQCAGETPPQETGLTYNSWYGKFHLEMVWWHQSHFALWQHPEVLMNTLNWYKETCPIACSIAQRQGFEGARWMKMTDPSGRETTSAIGSFLIWQQPHPIYLAELIYRANPSTQLIEQYGSLVQQTAEFIYSFADYDGQNHRYYLKGYIPAQERYNPETMVNSPFEMCYWLFGLETAQKWRERSGQSRCPEWDEMIRRFSPLFTIDGIYPPAESVGNNYAAPNYTTDHMSVLAALGVLPPCHLVDRDTMRNTLNWILENWNWEETWGWDYPMTAMTAIRLGEPQKAIDILLMNQQTNTYLNNGHNYQNENLRIYLPGNGGLLTAIALMCAGWDGNHQPNPGFPKDGNWDVRWEGLLPMP